MVAEVGLAVGDGRGALEVRTAVRVVVAPQDGACAGSDSIRGVARAGEGHPPSTGRFAGSPQARPIYHRTRDWIEAHLTIVFVALAVSRWIEYQTGWSIREFVKTARRYRPGRARSDARHEQAAAHYEFSPSMPGQASLNHGLCCYRRTSGGFGWLRKAAGLAVSP